MSSRPPQAALDDIDPTEVQQIVGSLQELHALGRPKTDEELEERINEFFSFCQRSSIRPGIESLCLALHITRQCLYNWCNGIQCTPRRQQACETAKSFIAAYIEQASLCGKINPASGIFLMKNWLNYKDSVSFEAETPKGNMVAVPVTRDELLAEFDSDNVTDNEDELQLPFM